MKTVLKICGAIILAALVFLCGIVLSSILFPAEETPGWFIGAMCVISIAVLALTFIKVFKRKKTAQKNTDFILENAPSTSVPMQNPVPHHSPELYDIEKEDESDCPSTISSAYKQSDDNDRALDVSPITGLPHKFTISDYSTDPPTDTLYDLDDIFYVQIFPPVTVPFSINGTSYYLNDYFRLCAQLYDLKGHSDIASALRKKADEIESILSSQRNTQNTTSIIGDIEPSIDVDELIGELHHTLGPIDKDEFLQQIIREEENWRREQRGLSPMEDAIYQMDHMEGHAFEHWCADLLQRYGYEDVEVTPGSNDQGVDVLAQKDGIRYAIQCKCYSSDLGNAPVQEVNTGKAIYHCHVGVVMTNRYFTQGAKDAAATGTLLWDRDKLIQMIKGM